jgi:hypothetical protein
MVPVQNYKKFFTDFIRKHMVIVGPSISVEIANSVNGIEVDPTGEVVQIQGQPSLILQDLSNSYQRLSAPITLLALRLLLEENQDIKKEYNQPLPHVKLVCALNEKVQ